MTNSRNTETSAATLGDKFACARDLIINKSKQDPPNDPYKSKYQAKVILVSIEQLLVDRSERDECSNKSLLENRLAIVYYLLGSISFDVEEPNIGYEYTTKALNLLSEDPINPDKIICYVCSLNILGFSACKYDKLDESLQYLEKADAAYKSYKETYEAEPKEFSTIFDEPLEEENSGLEIAYTSTLFYLAQLHSTRGNRLKSAKFCHTTLERQLALDEFDAIDWALNSATLSQYFIEKNAFKEAKNHLAAAQILLEKQSMDYKNRNDDSEEVKAMIESLNHRTADIFRCWAKYGVYLMNSSKERLISSEADTLDPVPQPPEELAGLYFTGFEEEKVKECECLVTSDFLLTYEDARPVFLVAQEWLNKAKEYYTLQDHASDHINILQDASQLYHLLAFFHPDEAIQCKLHKRRLDIIEKAVNELNPTYYLNVCQELWYELGEICLLMADLKRTQGENTKDQHFFTKSQQLYLQGIKYFEKYIDSFKLQSKNGIIQRYPLVFEKSIIMTYMFLGRMYSKLTSQEKIEILRTQKASLHCYRTVLEYCSVHTDITEVMPEELAICREMVQLIPLKMIKIERYM